MEFVDTHCHLQFPDCARDRGKVINNATEAKVTRLICVGTSLSDSVQAIDLAAQYEQIWATAGVIDNADSTSFANNPTGKKRGGRMP